MDDTAEIRARLRRIDSLADGRAARRELLAEVRSLLEEGERTLRSEEPGPVAGADGSERKPKAGDAPILLARDGPGEEADVP